MKMNPSRFDFCFYATVCPVCLQNPVCIKGYSLLKTCSGCSLVSYCTVNHQKQHWPLHKSFCRTLCKIVARMNVSRLYAESLEGYSFRDWNAIRLNIHHMCELILKRQLTASETQMVLFPRVCNLCHSSRAKSLKDCERCLCVSYCSNKHQEEDRDRHSKDCSVLRVCFDVETSIACNYDQFCQRILSSTLKVVSFHENYSVALSSLKDLSFLHNNKFKGAEDIIQTDVLSCVMTVIHAILVSQCVSRSTLSIEFVGASEYESAFFAQWEQLLHWFPHLEVLNLSFIGPQLSDQCSKDIHRFNPSSLHKVDVHVNLYCGELYSSYVKKCKSQPDLIFAFNCGFSEFYGSPQDTWANSIPYMLQKDCPLVMTSYTLEEAKLDLKCVKDVCKDVTVVVECEKNIFGSQRPHRDWEIQDNPNHSQVFYKNNFLSIVKLSQEL